MKGARVQSFDRNELLVRAGIVVVRGVERLVRVADEVKKELECEELLGSAGLISRPTVDSSESGGPIAQLGRELIDLVDHAGLRRSFRSRDPRRKRRVPETSWSEIRLRQFDVDQVPSPCRFTTDLGRVAVAVPIPVPIRPRGFTRDVVRGQRVGVRREQRRHLARTAGSR
jgi:hypothetical protein